MILRQMTMQTDRIHLDLCSSVRNVGFLKQSIDGEKLTKNIN